MKQRYDLNDNDHDCWKAHSHNEKFPPWWVFADDDDDEGDELVLDVDVDDDEGDELVLGKMCGFVRPDY